MRGQHYENNEAVQQILHLWLQNTETRLPQWHIQAYAVLTEMPRLFCGFHGIVMDPLQ
jgi:hypothetical protein